MNKKIYIALNNVRSLENVGAIMRTCSFFGIEHLILIGYSGTSINFKGQRVLHPSITKTALGAEKDLDIKIFETNAEFFSFISSENIGLVSVEQDPKSIKLHDFDLDNSSVETMCFVFGNEREGVQKEILERSSLILEIAKIGNKNSLNVATSVGIVVFKLTSN